LFSGFSRTSAASSGGIGDEMSRESMFKIAHLVADCAIVAFVAVSLGAPAFADDFPLTGNYTQNVPCKGDGTDPAAAKVTISPQKIISNTSACTILGTKRDGDSILVHVQCSFPSGPLEGDFTFTPRPNNTIEFVEHESAYKATLHRCPK
jgi:hypothetical protein